MNRGLCLTGAAQGAIPLGWPLPLELLLTLSKVQGPTGSAL